MAENTITGRAKKYDGTAIDYVSIFNWTDGTCIAQVVPDASGAWSYDYFTDLNVGITYVADGCEPITHGMYPFIFTINTITSGFLLLCYVDFRTNGVSTKPELNPERTDQPTWDEYFSQVVGLGSVRFVFASTGTAHLPWQVNTFDVFDKNWVLDVKTYALNAGAQKFTFELLDANNNVVAAVKSEGIGDFESTLEYGANLSTLTSATATDARPLTEGKLTFTDTQMIFTNNRTDSRGNKSFIFNADIASVVKIRIGAMAKLSSQGDTGSWIRIIPSG